MQSQYFSSLRESRARPTTARKDRQTDERTKGMIFQLTHIRVCWSSEIIFRRVIDDDATEGPKLSAPFISQQQQPQSTMMIRAMFPRILVHVLIVLRVICR